MADTAWYCSVLCIVCNLNLLYCCVVAYVVDKFFNRVNRNICILYHIVHIILACQLIRYIPLFKQKAVC